MLNGVKTTIDGDVCVYCNAKALDLYNFCPKCGNPLTLDAIRLKEQKDRKIKIELLDELAYLIGDEKSLKVILNKVKSI